MIVALLKSGARERKVAIRTACSEWTNLLLESRRRPETGDRSFLQLISTFLFSQIKDCSQSQEGGCGDVRSLIYHVANIPCSPLLNEV